MSDDTILAPAPIEPITKPRTLEEFEADIHSLRFEQRAPDSRWLDKLHNKVSRERKFKRRFIALPQ